MDIIYNMLKKENKKSVLILGDTGFLGSHIVDQLLPLYPDLSVSKPRLDLSIFEQTKLALSSRPDIVINCAAKQGGIEYNRNNPVEILEENIKIGFNVIKAASELGIKKLVNISASCSYPDGPDILKEEEYFNGRPHESVAYHGMAKRAIYELGRAYNKERGLNVITFCLTNLFGPHANFDPKSSKVVEATIKKIVDAKRNNLPSVSFFGNGIELREFLFVEDAAKLIIEGTEKYNDPQILNIGSGLEISIKELVTLVAEIVDYQGTIEWSGGPSGQLRKLLDSSKMRTILTTPITPLRSALETTVSWYQRQC